MAERPRLRDARRPFRPQTRALRVLAWFAALAALLLLVRDQLGPVLTLIAGLLVFSAGAGFVVAPLMRRHAGRGTPGDARLLGRRSFVVGAIVTLAGLALTGYGAYRVVEHAIAKAGSSSQSAPASLSLSPRAAAARIRP